MKTLSLINVLAVATALSVSMLVQAEPTINTPPSLVACSKNEIGFTGATGQVLIRVVRGTEVGSTPLEQMTADASVGKVIYTPKVPEGTVVTFILTDDSGKPNYSGQVRVDKGPNECQNDSDNDNDSDDDVKTPSLTTPGVPAAAPAAAPSSARGAKPDASTGASTNSVPSALPGAGAGAGAAGAGASPGATSSGGSTSPGTTSGESSKTGSMPSNITNTTNTTSAAGKGTLPPKSATNTSSTPTKAGGSSGAGIIVSPFAAPVTVALAAVAFGILGGFAYW